MVGVKVKVARKGRPMGELGYSRFLEFPPLIFLHSETMFNEIISISSFFLERLSFTRKHIQMLFQTLQLPCLKQKDFLFNIKWGRALKKVPIRYPWAPEETFGNGVKEHSCGSATDRPSVLPWPVHLGFSELLFLPLRTQVNKLGYTYMF